jgi:hypothetical protein
MKPADRAERFWSKVEATGFCWLWKESTVRGHGSFFLSRAEGKVYAHRWAYEYLVGPIPEGLELDHLCRVRHCVNPDHLEPVTHRTNFLRGYAVGAQSMRRGTCPNGHEYTPENTYVRKDGQGRQCKTCNRRKNNERYHRRKLAA